jgi:hypothetical protein
VLVELELRVVGSHREVVVRGLLGAIMVCVLVRGLVGLVMVLLDVPLLVLNTGLGEMIAALGSRGTTDHVFPLVVCNTLILLKFWLYKNLLETIYLPIEYKVVYLFLGI